MLKYTPREEVYGSKAAGRRVKERLVFPKHKQRPGRWSLVVHAHAGVVSFISAAPQHATRKCLMRNRHLVNECLLNETKKR